MSFQLLLGDCLERMKEIPDGSVDLVLCDPPYGTTACKWDAVIPFEPMWAAVRRVLKENGAAVLFGQEPFSSMLRTSNLPMFKYDWYWQKNRPSGTVNARLKPLKDVEVISVFSEGATANGSQRNMPYFPQGVGEGGVWKRENLEKISAISTARKGHKRERIIHGSEYPRQVLRDFTHHVNDNLHPTQKPVALMEYLIRTYTNEGATVLDFTMGSGTTGVACLNTGRRFIGIERDVDYFKIAKNRIEAVVPKEVEAAADNGLWTWLTAA